MEIKPVQSRVCIECEKEYSLNLFRPDGNTCRYCEEGLKPPLLKNEVAFKPNEIADQGIEDLDENNGVDL